MNSTFSEDFTTHKLDQDKVNTVVLFSNSGDDALAVLRVIGPAINSGLKVVRGEDNGIIQFDRILEGDIVVFQRDYSRELDLYEKIIKFAHDHSKPVVLDLDDLLLELPENHPDRISNFFAESMLPILQAIMEVDLVTVTTCPIQDYLLQYNGNIVVFQNYLNDQLWKIVEPVSNRSNDSPITIGYMGGHSHKPDIEMVSPILVKLLHKYPDNIVYKFWGIEPPAELAPYSQVDWCPPRSYTYLDFVTYFQTQTADIMIAPLADNLFNSCKSPIKFLEYSALGVPGVYSRITPYENIVEDGVDGLLASTSLEWEESLSKVIEDQELRRRIALNAQEKIRKSWLLSQNAYKLRQCYENLVISLPGHAHQVPPIHTLIKSLARQTFDVSHFKNQQISDNKKRINALQNENAQNVEQIEQKTEQIDQLVDQNAQLNEQIDQLSIQREDLLNRINENEEEIVSYVLSTSWQITRPLRKISRKLKKGHDNV